MKITNISRRYFNCYGYSLDDLLTAGITLADNVVIVNKESSNSMEEETLADCNTIVAVQTIFRFDSDPSPPISPHPLLSISVNDFCLSLCMYTCLSVCMSVSLSPSTVSQIPSYRDLFSHYIDISYLLYLS